MSNPSTTPNEKDGYRKALGLIETCFIQKSRALNLSGLGLSSLPREIGELSFLEQIILSENRLTELPLEFGYLKNLRTCDLRQNRLKSFPLKICQLSDLEMLLISYNQIEVLPPEIGMLSKLRQLGLRDNRITELPPEIGRLTELVELGVENNRLQRLPVELLFLKNLRLLFLHENPDLGISDSVLGPVWSEVHGTSDLDAANPTSILNYYFESVGKSKQSDHSTSQTEKLASIVFPSVQFEGATIEEAVEYLRVKSRDLDTAEKNRAKRGVNLILDATLDGNTASLSLDLKNVPMIKALQYITELAGVTFKAGHDKVVVKRRSEQDAVPEIQRHFRAQTLVHSEGATQVIQGAAAKCSEALRLFLTHERTQAPLTVSIEGAWGSGKSSVMLHLRDSLENPVKGQMQLRTVWFNPWKFEAGKALWAAFAVEMERQLMPKGRCKRLRSQLNLLWKRLEVLEKFILVVRWISWLALLLALVYAAFIGDFSEHSLKSEIFSLLSKLGIPFAILGLASEMLKQLASPLKMDVKALYTKAAMADHLDDLHRFYGDFRRMLQVLVPKNKNSSAKHVVVVFIDDLDRCEAPKAAELLQSLHLLMNLDDEGHKNGDAEYGETPGLIFIMGMDQEKVAAAVAAKHEKLLPYLEDHNNDGKVSRQEALSFGREFLEKFIHLTLHLPRLDGADMENYLEKLCGGKGALTAFRAHRESHVRKSIKEGDFDKMDRSLNEMAAGTNMDNAQIIREANIERLMEYAERPEVLHAAAVRAAGALDHNPRKLKQFVNLFRLRCYLGAETDTLETDMDSVGSGKISLKQLAVLVVLDLSVPNLMAEAREGRSTAEQLHRNVQSLERGAWLLKLLLDEGELIPNDVLHAYLHLAKR